MLRVAQARRSLQLECGRDHVSFCYITDDVSCHFPRISSPQSWSSAPTTSHLVLTYSAAGDCTTRCSTFRMLGTCLVWDILSSKFDISGTCSVPGW